MRSSNLQGTQVIEIVSTSLVTNEQTGGERYASAYQTGLTDR